MPKRFLDKKCYKYTLLSDHYDSSDILGNRTGKFFAAFFDKFAQGVLEANLAIYEGFGEFPAAWSEKNAYASIAHALHSLTPYVYSEVFLNYKDKETRKNPTNADKWRFVDFWAMDENFKLEMWIEVKKIWLNIGKNAKISKSRV